MIHTPMVAAAASDGPQHFPELLLALAAILVGAKLAGEALQRLGQPPVLGELLFGILAGNLQLFGGPSLAGLMANETFTALAELGAILLLFHVGLESAPRDLVAVGLRATAVAVVGVIVPMALGFGVGELFRPQDPWMAHAFLGSMLAATSVGITARVLKDAGALHMQFAKIILGAAVIDDVLGLLLLAVVSGVITAAATGQAMSITAVVFVVAKAFAFLFGALAIGTAVSPRIFRRALSLRSTGIVQALSLSFCFLLSYLAMKAGLAAIVGAFAAGLVLEGPHFEDHVKRGERPLHESLEPLTAFLVPVFFVRMGMIVDVRTFASPSVLGFAAALTLAAIVGKMVCGLVVPPGVPRLVVGFGMLPRGEVGLIFAAMGTRLLLEGRPVVDTNIYAAAVFMVVMTTMASPPLLLWAMKRAGVDA